MKREKNSQEHTNTKVWQSTHLDTSVGPDGALGVLGLHRVCAGVCELRATDYEGVCVLFNSLVSTRGVRYVIGALKPRYCWKMIALNVLGNLLRTSNDKNNIG